MKKETVRTIAERTGTSATTVSRVLSGKADKYRISADTERKVKEAARLCGYFPEMRKRSCISGAKSRNIGLVIPSVAENFYSMLSSSIITTNANLGYSTIIVDTQRDPIRERHEISNLISKDIDGLIISPCPTNQEFLEEAMKKVPMVQVDDYVKSTKISIVTSDNYDIGRSLTNLLLNAGHSRILCLGGAESTVNSERIQGYLNAMKDAGLEPRLEGSSYEPEDNYQLIRQIMRSDDRPTGIVTLANGQSLGVMKAAISLGLNIPGDFSLVTVDDNRYMSFVSPNITRINQSIDGMAYTSCNLLNEMIHGRRPNSTSMIKLRSTLIEGESVAPYHSSETKL